MTIKSYSLANKRRDLSASLDVVIAGMIGFISLFVKSGKKAKNPKHEWLQDAIIGRAIAIISVVDSTATVSEDDNAKIAVGTTFVIKDDPALFKVTGKPTATTFTFALVAAHGSATTTLVADNECDIVSTPMKEGTGNGDGEGVHRAVGKDNNCTQIFRKEATVSGTAIETDTYDNVENNINQQTQFALLEVGQDLNRAAIHGHRQEVSDTQNGSLGGLYFFGTQEGGIAVDAGTAAISSGLINDGAQKIIAAGGTPDVIVCSPGQARVISAENKDKVVVYFKDESTGSFIGQVKSDITGKAMKIIADSDMPDGDVWVCDSKGFALVPMTGRDIHDTDATDKGFDGIKRIVLGEVTLEFRNAKQRLARIHNLKASATALAA